MTFLSRGREGSQLLHKKQTKIRNFKYKKKYKPKCLSAITKNLNWQILTKNSITFKRQDGVIKMKNVDIMGVHQFLGEEGHKKQYIRGIA